MIQATNLSQRYGSVHVVDDLTFPYLLGPAAGLMVMCAYTAGALLIGGLALVKHHA